MRFCVLTLSFTSAMLAQSPPPLLQALPGPDTVVATVGGVNVTVKDIQKMLEETSPQVAQSFQKAPQETIRQLFLMRYLAEQGEKAKLGEKSPYKEQLDFMRASVLANLMMNQERDGYAVSGQEIDRFYEQNQSRWQQSKIKIIFVGFKPGSAQSKVGLTPEDIAKAARQAFESAHTPSDRSEDEAAKLAADLVKQLREGSDFVKLVAQYSDEATSKAAGGDFGAVTITSSYSDDFKRPVLALKQGEISDPIKQSNGYYIVRVEEKSVQPLNDVREQIVQELRKTHLDDYMKDLNNKFAPSILRPDFFLQPGRYLAPGSVPTPAPTH